MWYSRTFKALLGYRGQEIPNRLDTWKAHLHPDDCEPTYATLRTHLEHNHPHDVVYRLRTKEGNYRWFRARGKSAHDEHGRPVHMAGSIQDVSDLKATKLKVEQTAAELARSNQDLEEFAYVASHDLRALLRATKNLAEWMEAPQPEARSGAATTRSSAAPTRQTPAAALERCNAPDRPARCLARGLAQHRVRGQTPADSDRQSHRNSDDAKTPQNPAEDAVSCGVLSGEGEIRTPGTQKGTPVFETGPIGHSGTSPGFRIPCRFAG